MLSLAARALLRRTPEVTAMRFCPHLGSRMLCSESDGSRQPEAPAPAAAAAAEAAKTKESPGSASNWFEDIASAIQNDATSTKEPAATESQDSSWFNANVAKDVRRQVQADPVEMPDAKPTSQPASEPKSSSSSWFAAAEVGGTGVSTGEADGDLEAMPAQVIVEQKKKRIQFTDLPILKIQLKKNNTIMDLYTADGRTVVHKTAGICGYKGAKRGTNVAGQACGEILAKIARSKGHNFVRVRMAGLGAARTDALRGLEIGGVRIVSITDETKSYPSQRPRKARRV